MLFAERYDYVGKLLRPGEVPTNYSDEEEEGSQQESETKTKDDWPIESQSMNKKKKLINHIIIMPSNIQGTLLKRSYELYMSLRVF